MTFVSYAKNHEDYRLFLALKTIDQGRYIDFSGSEDCLGSFSEAFYERGWSGICNHGNEHNRQRDRFVTGTLNDLHGQEAEWINAADIHFLTIDAELSVASLKAFFEQATCRPWLVVVRDQQGIGPNDGMSGAFTDAGYVYCWSDNVNSFWVTAARSDLVTNCFVPLTHRHQLIGVELLELRAQHRLQKIQADELARTCKKLSAREKEIEQLNQGLESTRQAYEGAMFAYETVLASSNRLPLRILKKIVTLPKRLLRKCRHILIKSIRLPALKVFAYIEQRPLLLAKLMQRINAYPALEKIVRKIIGKPKAVKAIPRHVDEPCPTLSPDELKAYQQIIGS